MERRSFLSAGLGLATVGTVSAKNKENNLDNTLAGEGNELYEWRTYDIKWGSNVKLLTTYLKDVLKPTLLRHGAKQVMVFDEIAPGSPKKIYALISYPDANTYMSCQNLSADESYNKSAESYNSIAPDKPLYNRFNSSLLVAFDGMKEMLDPVNNATVFELRIYEGYSEDAVRRKIKMFDDEEIELFHKVGLNPVFFGKMISGPYRPCLVYMLNFTDMDAHGAAWKEFIKAPEWNEMKVKPMYANTVSNIRNTFLKQI